MNNKQNRFNPTKLFSFKSSGILLATLALLSFPSVKSWAQEFPKPGPEHTWLQQFVGEWDSDTEIYMEPGKPPTHTKGTTSVRPLGGFWTITEVKSTMMSQPFSGIMTLGYDTEKKEYIGTWVDSMTGHLWTYEGHVDASGKALTLEAEGACPMQPGKHLKFKEVLELKDKNHQVFTSYMQGDDGKWIMTTTSHSQRKQ